MSVVRYVIHAGLETSYPALSKQGLILNPWDMVGEYSLAFQLKQLTQFWDFLGKFVFLKKKKKKKSLGFVEQEKKDRD